PQPQERNKDKKNSAPEYDPGSYRRADTLIRNHRSHNTNTSKSRSKSERTVGIKSHSTGSKNDQKDHSREHYVPIQSCSSQETGNRCQYISHSYKSSKSCQQLCFYICAVGRQLKLFFKPFFH